MASRVYHDPSEIPKGNKVSVKYNETENGSSISQIQTRTEAPSQPTPEPVSHLSDGIQETTNTFQIVDPLVIDSTKTDDVNTLPTNEVVGYKQIDAKTALNRKVFIGHLNIDTETTGFVGKYQFPKVFFTKTFPGSNLFNVYKYIEASKMKIYAQSSVSPTAVGTIYIRWFPGNSDEQSSSFGPKWDRSGIRVANTIDTTTRFIDLGIGNSIEFEVPLISPRQALDTRAQEPWGNGNHDDNPNWNFWGTLEIGVYNPIGGNDTMASSTIDLNIFAELIDPNLSVMIPYRTVEGGAFSAMAEVVAPVLIGATADTVTSAIVGKKCTKFTLSSEDGFMLNNVMTNDSRHVVSLAYTQEDLEITNSPTHDSLADVDLKGICAKRSIIKTLKMDNTDKEGDIIGEVDVDVIEVGKYATHDGARIYEFSNLGGISRFFDFWRGDITLTFDAISNAYTRGALLLAYEPYKTTINSYEEAMASPSVILNLAEKKTIALTIPYNNYTPWMEVSPGNSKETYLNDNLGRIVVYVASSLRFLPGVPGSLHEIDINIMVHSDNMEFRAPVNKGIWTTRPPVITPLVTEVDTATAINIFGENATPMETSAMPNTHMDLRQLLTKRQIIGQKQLKAGFHKFHLPIPCGEWLSIKEEVAYYTIEKGNPINDLMNAFSWVTGSYVVSVMTDNATDARTGIVARIQWPGRRPIGPKDRVPHYEEVDEAQYYAASIAENTLTLNRSALTKTDIHVPMYSQFNFLPSTAQNIGTGTDTGNRVNQRYPMAYLDLYCSTSDNMNITLALAAGPGFKLSQFVGMPYIINLEGTMNSWIGEIADDVINWLDHIFGSEETPTDPDNDKPKRVDIKRPNFGKTVKEICHSYETTTEGAQIWVCDQCHFVATSDRLIGEHKHVCTGEFVKYQTVSNKELFWACDQCSMRCRYDSDLYRHKKSAHGQTFVHFCANCGTRNTKDTKCERNCKQYLRNECEDCGSKCKGLDKLLVHKKKTHGPIVEMMSTFHELGNLITSSNQAAQSVPMFAQSVDSIAKTTAKIGEELIDSSKGTRESIERLVQEVTGTNQSVKQTLGKIQSSFSPKQNLAMTPREISTIINTLLRASSPLEVVSDMISILLDRIPSIEARGYKIPNDFIVVGLKMLITFIPVPDCILNAVNVWLASRIIHFSQNFIIENVLTMVESDGSGNVKGALAILFLLFTALSGITNPMRMINDLKDAFRLVNFKRVSDSVMSLIDAIQALYKFVMEKITGVVNEEEVDWYTANRAKINEMIEFSIETSSVPIQTILADNAKRREVVRWRDFTKEFFNHASRVERIDQVFSYHIRIAKELQLTIKQCLIAPDSKQRQRPVPLTLYGASQVGKTYLTSRWIPQALSHVMKWNDTSVYEKPSTTDMHWTGYVGQPIMTINDAGSRQDCEDLMLYLNLIGNEPLSLNMAHLEDKGIKFFSSVVIATTNVVAPKVSRVYTNKEAFFNRWFENFVEVIPKDEFKTPRGTLDKTKVSPKMSPDVYSDVYIHEDPESVERGFGTKTTWKDLVYSLANQIKNERDSVQETESFDFDDWAFVEGEDSFFKDPKYEERSKTKIKRAKVCLRVFRALEEGDFSSISVEDMRQMSLRGVGQNKENKYVEFDTTWFRENWTVSDVGKFFFHKKDDKRCPWVKITEAVFGMTVQGQEWHNQASCDAINRNDLSDDGTPWCFEEGDLMHDIIAWNELGHKRRKGIKWIARFFTGMLFTTGIIIYYLVFKGIGKIAQSIDKFFTGLITGEETTTQSPKPDEQTKSEKKVEKVEETSSQAIMDAIKQLQEKVEIYNDGPKTGAKPKQPVRASYKVESDTVPGYYIFIRNLVEVSYGPFKMNAFGVRGHEILVNRHFIRQLKEGDIFTVGFGSERITNYEVAFKKANLAQLSYEGADTDLAMYSLDWTGPQFKDLTNHFINDEDFIRVHNCEGYRLSHGLVTTLPALQFIEGVVAMDPGSDNVTYPMSIFSKGKRSAGKCGSPWIVENPRYFGNIGKICGIHSWGQSDMIGSSPVSYETVMALLSKFSTPIVEEPHIPTTEMEHNYNVYTVHGYVDNDKSQFLNTKTKIQPTPWIGEVFPIKTAPSVLSAKDKRLDVEMRDGFKQRLVGKTDHSTGWFKKPQVFEQAVSAVRTELSTYEQVEARKLTPFEVANGLSLEGWEHDLKLEMRNSPGYPYNKEPGKGKTPFFEQGFSEDGVQIWEPKHQIMEDTNKRIELAKTGKVAGSSFWIDILKDELRPLAKVKAGKTRIVNGPPLDLIMAFGIFFGAFKALLMHPENRGMRSESALGLDPIASWPEIGMNLKASSSTFGVDYSSYDATIPAELHRGVLRAINGWYLDNAKDKEECLRDNEIRSILFYEIPHTRHLYGNILYDDDHGLPSGAPAGLTTISNIMVNKLLSRTAFGYLGIPPIMFQDCIGALFMGDDNLQWIKPNVPEKYRMVVQEYDRKHLARVAGELGMVVTMPDKSPDLTSYDKFEELSFLKRTFSDKIVPHYYLPEIELETCRKLINWVRPESNPNQAYENMCEALVFIAPRGKLAFDEFKTTLLQNVKINVFLRSGNFQLPIWENIVCKYYNISDGQAI